MESITTYKMDQMEDRRPGFEDKVIESEYSDNKIIRKHKQNMQGVWDIIKRLDLWILVTHKQTNPGNSKLIKS